MRRDDFYYLIQQSKYRLAPKSPGRRGWLLACYCLLAHSQIPARPGGKSMSLDNLGQISSIVAAVIAILGFPVIFLQLRVAGQQRQDAIKLSGSQVLLAVDAVLAVYQDINRNLRPRGDWYCSREHPTDDELPLVEPYLGVFERLWIAYSIGQIDIAT